MEPSILIAIIALTGTVATALWGRRSAKESTTVEERRVGLEVLKTSLTELRTTVDDERTRSRDLEDKVEALSKEVHTAREEAKKAWAQAVADADYIDLLLEHWPRPPEPPARPN